MFLPGAGYEQELAGFLSVRLDVVVHRLTGLLPREIEASSTPVTERMSDAQLEAIIARGIEGGLDPAAPDEDAQMIQ